MDNTERLERINEDTQVYLFTDGGIELIKEDSIYGKHIYLNSESTQCLKKILTKQTDELKAELNAIAQYWRNDWTEFDGRTLKFQIEDVIKNFDSGEVGNYYRFKLKEQEDKL